MSWSKRIQSGDAECALCIERLRSIEEIDSGPGHGLLIEVLELYLVYSRETFARLAAEVEKRAVDKIHKVAHSLKSSSLNVGAERLAKLCGALEHRTKAEEFAQRPYDCALDLLAIEQELGRVQIEIGRIGQVLKNDAA